MKFRIRFGHFVTFMLDLFVIIHYYLSCLAGACLFLLGLYTCLFESFGLGFKLITCVYSFGFGILVQSVLSEVEDPTGSVLVNIVIGDVRGTPLKKTDHFC